MVDAPYQAAHVSELPALVAPDGSTPVVFRGVRRYFGIQSFGVNAIVAEKAGDAAVEEHAEADEGGTGHEELYFVGSGHATFTVGGETVEAPAGTFVYVRDPTVVRSAVARADGTTVLAVGGLPGVPFSVSSWEDEWAVD